jgi:hypothetical protein
VRQSASQNPLSRAPAAKAEAALYFFSKTRLILRHRLLAGNLIFRPAACADGQIISGSFSFLRVLFLLFGFFSRRTPLNCIFLLLAQKLRGELTFRRCNLICAKAGTAHHLVLLKSIFAELN